MAKRNDLRIDFGPELRPALRRAARRFMLPEAAIVRAAVRAELRRLAAEADSARQVPGSAVSAPCQEPGGEA